MGFMLIGPKDDQRTLCMSYCELLLIGGLKAGIFLSKFRNQIQFQCTTECILAI